MYRNIPKAAPVVRHIHQNLTTMQLYPKDIIPKKLPDMFPPSCTRDPVGICRGPWFPCPRFPWTPRTYPCFECPRLYKYTSGLNDPNLV